MRAIIMQQPGDIDVLQENTLPTPTLRSPHHVLIRLHAAGVNPIDTKLRARGSYFPDHSPTILGCDGAGIIEAIGDAVQRFQVGDAVYFCHGGIGDDQGNYAEYTVAHEDLIALKPHSLDFTQAAAVPLALITAWESLYERTNTCAENTVLIHGGAGGVGHLAIQLARLRGARVITTVSDENKSTLARSLGAEQCIDYRHQDFVIAVNEWTDGAGVDIALDTVGGQTLQRSFGCVKYYGDLVTLLQPAQGCDWKEARLRNLRITQELMLTPMARRLHHWRKHQARLLEQAAALFDQGQLKVVVSHELALAQAADAHRLIEQGGTVGKVVLRID